jgi:hypothetical protein
MSMYLGKVLFRSIVTFLKKPLIEKCFSGRLIYVLKI